MKKYLVPFLFFVFSLAPAGAAQAQWSQPVTTPYWCGSYYSSWPCSQQPASSYYYPYTTNYYSTYSYYPYNYGYQYGYQNYNQNYYYTNQYRFQGIACPIGYYSHSSHCYPFPPQYNYNYGYGYPYYYNY